MLACFVVGILRARQLVPDMFEPCIWRKRRTSVPFVTRHSVELSISNTTFFMCMVKMLLQLVRDRTSMWYREKTHSGMMEIWRSLPGISLRALMVVLMTAASCLNKDLHTNGYNKETWIKIYNWFNTNSSVSIHVENLVIWLSKYIWNLMSKVSDPSNWCQQVIFLLNPPIERCFLLKMDLHGLILLNDQHFRHKQSNNMEVLTNLVMT